MIFVITMLESSLLKKSYKIVARMISTLLAYNNVAIDSLGFFKNATIILIMFAESYAGNMLLINHCNY